MRPPTVLGCPMCAAAGWPKLTTYVEERTHAVTWLGVTMAARIAPMVLGGPLGGPIADRFGRRRLMIGADALRAAIMGALVPVAATHRPVVLRELGCTPDEVGRGHGYRHGRKHRMWPGRSASSQRST